MRFPGGCYVEGGDHLKNRPEWKKALGPIEDRPGHANANWGYWSTDGESIADCSLRIICGAQVWCHVGIAGVWT